MRNAMVAVVRSLRAAASAIGLEGFLLGIGTAALAAAAQFFHPVGGLIVVGCVSLILGFAVALRGA